MFDPKWLQERYRFDAAARNKELEWEAIHQFAFLEHLQIVDLGSGTGANVRYYLEQFPQNQTWYCVEEDGMLREVFWQNMLELAHADGYQPEQEGDSLKMTKSGHWVEIHFVQGNLMELDKLVDLLRTDLILANAVFDLFSADQFAELIHVISHHSLSMLFSLNYEGMAFFPQEEKDDFFIRQYNAHMQRPQDFGHGMGPDASQVMKEALNKKLGHVKRGQSIWEIAQEDTEMLRFLLGFFEDALVDWWENEAEKTAFNNWLEDKKAMLESGKLSAHVYHQDILASFFPNIARTSNE